MSEFAVELRNVRKVFSAKEESGVAAVQEISLQIKQGEFFTLLGPSGCGKTTTLRMIAGFETPTSGEVLILGKLSNDIPPYKRPVNTVFQNYALFPHLTVEQNVAYGLVVKRVNAQERKRRVAEALALVRMNPYANRKPAELSGGQQQRVALARALVNEPEVLLLDEPLGALDLKLRKQMQYELKHLQTQVETTFIYVTHDQEEALTMSNRIAVMNEGYLLQVAEPVEIYERPATRFVADFIGETNFLKATVAGFQEDYMTALVAGELVTVTRSNLELTPDQNVTLSVRPERLFVSFNGDESAPTLFTVHGTLEEMVYLGTDTRFTVRLNTGEKLAVRVQNTKDTVIGEYSPGDRVMAWCDPEDVHTLVE